MLKFLSYLKKLKVKTSMSRLKVLGITITTVRFVFEGFVAELKAECRIMLKCIFDINTESKWSKHTFQGQMFKPPRNSVGEGKVKEMSLVGRQQILSADESMTGHCDSVHW